MGMVLMVCNRERNFHRHKDRIFGTGNRLLKAFVASSTSRADVMKAAWRRSQKLPSHSLGFRFPGLQSLVWGVLCKNHPKRSVFDPLLPPGGQLAASPHSQDSDPGEDTLLGPGCGCHCGSTRPGRVVRRTHPEAGPWKGLNPRSRTRSNCRVCLQLGCTRCLGKCLELGEAGGGCSPCFV